MFRPPPRITLKLKMPKVTLGNGKTGSKSGNGPLCPDTSGNVYDRSGGGMVPTGKSQHYASRVRKEDHANGLLSASGRSRGEAEGVAGGGSPLPPKPSGKPLALHAALHGRSANGGGGKLEAPQRTRLPKSNGVMEKGLPHREASCPLVPGPGAPDGPLGSLRKPGAEHFGRSLKEATVCLVRTPEDLRGPEKPSRKGSGKERPWGKSAPERHSGKAPSYQENDGYCPDLELSDSEPEAKGKRRQARVPACPGKESPTREYSKGGSRGKLALGSRASVQR